MPRYSDIIIFLFVVLSNFMFRVTSYEKTAVDELDIDLGSTEGLSKTSTISTENLKRILDGVESGNKENIYYYGLLKLYGISIRKDESSASANFLRASQLGHKEATTAYGLSLMSGIGVDQDYESAIVYFRKAVNMGDANAHWLLGKMLMEGKGVPSPQYMEAALLFKKAADEDNVPQAQHLLAFMHEYGMGGVPQDFDLAAKYYHTASEQNHLESTYNLGLMYAFGRGIPQDYVKARSLLEQSAAHNHAPSIYYIGVFKTYGYGCTINYEQAANWFERASALHDNRVSDKAYKAHAELRRLIDEAEKVNNKVQDSFVSKKEHSSGSDGGDDDL